MSDLERLDGLFVGQLDNEEMRLFERAVAEHRAYRGYEGEAGFMGLAKVRLVRVVRSEPESRVEGGRT